jgi:hypothetical protein
MYIYVDLTTIDANGGRLDAFIHVYIYIYIYKYVYFAFRDLLVRSPENLN